MTDKIYLEPRTTRYKNESIIEGNILVIGEEYAPYDFLNWREAANFLIDKCYGLKRAMRLTEKDKEHLEMRCPLTGEYLTVLGSEDDLENIHRLFILHNLYRHDKHSL